MLLGSFYKIIDFANNGDKLSATVEFNAGHQIFTGHFPALPVVPGVCQTQMLNELLNHTFKKELSMKRAAQIKFLALLNPVKTPRIRIDVKMTDAADGSILINADYFWEEVAYFKFKGEFK